MVNQSQVVFPLNMIEMLKVKADGYITIPYTANFTDCYNNGYTELKKTEQGKIHGFSRCRDM